MDGIETNETTQEKIRVLWEQVTQDNFHELSDYKGYHQDFFESFLDSVLMVLIMTSISLHFAAGSCLHFTRGLPKPLL